MIVKMNKYTLVLYHKAQEEFLARLQELGVVDITTSGWEPNEREREVLGEIEAHKAASEAFAALKKQPKYLGGEPFASGEEAYENYRKASAKIDSLTAQIAKAEKEAEELSMWGDFAPESIARLEAEGILLHFYSCYSNEYAQGVETWSENYTVEPISERGGVTYFVVVSRKGEPAPQIDAQVVKTPSLNADDKRREIAALQAVLSEWESVMARCVASESLIADHANGLKDELQFSQVSRSGEGEADGKLIVLQGWAPEANAKEVDALLDAENDVFYVKEKPTMEDDTPVKLKNGWFAKPFEFIGDFYAVPKYGTMDLTKYFAPFYMLFFGFCIGDAGYGATFFLIGLFMYLKKMKGMGLISQLVMWLGFASMVFGLCVGNIFGVSLIDSGVPEWYNNAMQTINDQLFYIALGCGIVQIIFALVLNVINTTIAYGFKYSFGTLGWLIILVDCLLAFLLPMVGVAGFGFSSPIFLGVLIFGAVFMLLLNNPNRNPLVNFGSGLWDTYNNLTGLLGDVLSYVRLFAISLSGGALAVVFNDLAGSLAPDTPGLRQVVMFLILAFGHGINIFMSAIGAFVHPMRLTFIEFYKNAGFEAATRVYTPFEKRKTN
ncbi:MAG: V-type ATP synthase subunit I [Tidjanibacter sp.]|nr:V-type ATP synthase subunit I [Tidjanibacter sp.]